MLVAVAVAAATLARAALPGASPPTDNPVATAYGNGTYPWASAINWTNVVNAHDFGGSLEKAQAALTRSGGGVLYIPPGTIELSENFQLASSVVLRGAPASGAAKQGTKPGSLKPTSILKCPDRKHIGVLNYDANAINLGLVNLMLDGCAVMLWPRLAPQPWSMKSYWYEATSVVGMGSNKLVLGCVVVNVNLASSNPGTVQDGWPWTFSTAVAVYSDKNALVANNLLQKATATATMKLGDGTTVPYPYDNRYGIDVNRVLLGGAFGKLVPGASPGHCTDAQKQFPWSFRSGLVIRDNYVYGDGRVGVSFSGAGDGKTVGSGTKVFGNHVEHNPKGIFYGFAPGKLPHGSDTNENRGYDQAGIENNVTGNTGHIYRQQLYKSPYETVDGEGILVQCTNGNNQYRNLWSNNDLSGGGSGYIAYYGVDVVEDCVITGNKVNSDQKIGLMNCKNCKVSGLKCSGNHPAADCKPGTEPAARPAKAPMVPAAATERGAPPTCRDGPSGVFHVTNPGPNRAQLLLCAKFDNATKSCDPSSVTLCGSSEAALVPPNVTSVKFYNVSAGTTQAFAFALWATQPLSYHALTSVAQSPWQAVPSGSEPAISVPYPSSSRHGVLCDTGADCEAGAACQGGVCGAPAPPPPPPPPFPPLPTPAASACDVGGEWFLGHKTQVNMSATTTKGVFSFVCSAHTPSCFGGGKQFNGTVALSSTDSKVTVKASNGTVVATGVVNSTYTCNLMTFPVPGEKSSQLSRKSKAPAPPFGLSVASAGWLGTTETPFVPVAALFVQTAGTRVGGESSGELATIGGNGPHAFGLTPTGVLNATADANGTIVFLSLPADASHGVAPSATAVYRVGARLDHISVSGEYLAAAGSFGVALFRVGSSTLDVAWANPLALAERGDCGLCCSGQQRCRTSVGMDGTVGLILPTGGSETAVVTLSVKDGSMLGAVTHNGRTVTDIEVTDNAVYVTSFYPSDTGREPMVMPSMEAFSDYTLTKQLYRNWAWGSGHPYRESGPCDGDVADSRAELVRVSRTDPTQLLFVGRSDGGNGVFGCQTDNVLNKAPLFGWDDYSEPFNMQAQAISYLGKLKASTGQILGGSLNLARLPSGEHGGNTLHTVAVDEDARGNLYYAQTAACCIQNMANLTVEGHVLFPAGDGMALEVVAGNLSARLLWHHFATETQPAHSGSSAVDVSVGAKIALMVGVSSQVMVVSNALPGTSGPSGGSEAGPPNGYLVAVPLAES